MASISRIKVLQETIKRSLKQAAGLLAKTGINIASGRSALLADKWQKYAPTDLDGWQLLFSIQMLLVTPAVSAYFVLTELQQYQALRASFAGPIYSTLMLLLALCSCAYSIVGGVELLRKREWATLQQAARILWVTGPLVTLVLLIGIPWLVFGGLNENQTFGHVSGKFVASLGVAYAWTLYLINSEQMHYCYNAPTTGPIDQGEALNDDAMTSAANSVIGNKVPFYILLLFAVLLFGLLKYHVHAPAAHRQALPKKQDSQSLVVTKNQMVSPVLQEAATLPAINVGDSYLLESIDAAHPANNHKTKRVVSAVTGDGFDLSVVNLKSKTGKARTLTFDKGWNLIATRNADHSGYDYAPALKYYDFPLTPGKTWKQTSIETDNKTGATKKHVITGVVGGWEEISVPAGTFHALKVNLQTELYDPKSQQKTIGTDVSWYAPETKRSVKSDTSLTDARGNVERSSLQLIQYAVAQH